MENQITLADMAKIKNIIEVACTRGSFRAEEMRAVGEVYERLTAFLDNLITQAPKKDDSNKVQEEAGPTQGDQE